MHEISDRFDCPEPAPCWLAAPPERSGKFLPTFARISVAIQSALREHVPSIYFKNADRYRDLKAAYPMLVYQASRPYRGRVRTELTYDVLDSESMSILFRRAKPNFASLLAKVDSELRASDMTDLALKYSPRHAMEIMKSVQKLSVSRRYLFLLVRSESMLVDALVELSGLGTFSAREQCKKMTTFRKKWRFQLRRLYPGGDFSVLAPILLDTATEALLSSDESRGSPASDVDLVGPSESGSGAL